MSVTIKRLSLLAWTACLCACSGTEFGSDGKKVSNTDTDPSSDVAAIPDIETTGPNSTIEIGANGLIKENFKVTSEFKTAKVDFLIILDDSVSMGAHSKGVAEGLLAIATEEFPANSRIGVITTMAGAPKDFTQPHPDINRYPGIEKEPGFLDLVKADDVKAFKAQAASPYKESYDTIQVCDQGWFKPQDTNAKGDRCFQGALQNPFFGVGCEPGPLAFAQFMTKFKGQEVFRSGAHVNAIIVSDEQEGCKSPETTTDLPTAATLTKQAVEELGSASLTIHGLLPKEDKKPNTNAVSNTKRYYKLIEETKGVVVALDNTTNYGKVMSQILDAAKEPTDTFDLQKPVKEIVAVRVNGKTIDAYKMLNDHVLKLEDFAISDESMQVEIDYYPK